ncbi:MAG: hypothetical protein HC890_00695 [Chloroflexaceae bacterium]|nr:hypothetical protein [Chloroflexaceae bacterium]
MNPDSQFTLKSGRLVTIGGETVTGKSVTILAPWQQTLISRRQLTRVRVLD